jgi:DNA-binding CsgD family transcriptional regulator
MEANNQDQNGSSGGVAAVEPASSPRGKPRNLGAPLSSREREVVEMLAGGASGADIAERLVLSPETVRTHIRNAMAKLGASSRAQAVALAVQRQEIDWPSKGEPATAKSDAGTTQGSARSRVGLVATGEADATLAELLTELTSLYEVDGGMIFVTEKDGLSLRRAALHETGSGEPEPPTRVQFGEGPLGRVALERRAQVIQGSGSRIPAGDRATVCVPMIAGGALVGVICLTFRPSRLIGRAELLLLQAFATRVAEILLSAEDHRQQRVKVALESFRASWSSSGR